MFHAISRGLDPREIALICFALADFLKLTSLINLCNFVQITRIVIATNEFRFHDDYKISVKTVFFLILWIILVKQKKLMEVF